MRSTDAFKGVLGEPDGRRIEQYCPIEPNASRLFDLNFDMQHPALRACLRLGAVVSILTDGYAASVTRAHSDEGPEGDRKDYLDQDTLLKVEPHQIVSIDQGKKALMTGFQPAHRASGRPHPKTFEYNAYLLRREAGMPRAEWQMIARKRSTIVAGDPQRRSIEALESALGGQYRNLLRGKPGGQQRWRARRAGNPREARGGRLPGVFSGGSLSLPAVLGLCGCPSARVLPAPDKSPGPVGTTRLVTWPSHVITPSLRGPISINLSQVLKSH
jgi:hypothetical protein